jgi:thioredoxin-related protein
VAQSLSRCLRLAVVGCAVCAVAVAGEGAKVAWLTDVDDAWTATLRQGRPLLVFVTRENCAYCTQMKQRTYGNEQVAATINHSFVALLIDGKASSPLSRELNVTAYPATFVISPQAVVVERIDGFVPPEVLAARLNSMRPRATVAKVAP